MDFERLERVWRSNENSLNEKAAAWLMEETMETLKRRRRSFRTGMTVVGVALGAWTLKIAWDVATSPFPFDLSGEWGAVALLVLPWVALFVIGAQYRRHALAHPDPYASMPDTLRALIDENATARGRVRMMALIMVVFTGLMALTLGQLVDAGKMTPQNVRDGALVFGAVLALVWGGIAIDYFRRLRPEADRLRRLLADYENTPG